MRLHRLRVEAFGPFADVQEVDFDTLSESGLFLLHGATGAGKTTILDAVCFALYGQVPGARAGGRPRLRSDHAAVGVPPRVVLELTVRGRRLEITRSPEWSRPKKRGTGTTREPASTDVRELVDGSWQVVVGRRSDEAGLLLTDLLGMGLEQFTKVVLLPQGEFAAFLRAGAEQRGELLGRLFDIDRFTGVETWLRDQRQLLAREVAEADAARDALVARAHEMAELIAGSPVTTDDEMALADPPGPLVVEALARTAGAAAQQARVRVEAARTDAADASTAVATATEVAQRCERHRLLATQLAELDRRAGEHAAAVEHLDAALRAATMQRVLGRHDAARTREAATGADLEQARRHADETLGGPLDDSPPLAAFITERATDLARLDDTRKAVAELVAVTERLAAAQAEVEGAAADLEQADQQARDAEQLLREADRQVAAHSPVAARREAAEQALAAAHRVRQAADDLVVAEQTRSTLEQARRSAHDGELAARQAWLDLRERRLAGMAAELAAGLTHGGPCAVCGSLEHPHPAQPADDHADEQSEQEALARHEAAAQRLRAVEGELSDAAGRCAALAASSQGLDVAAAAAAVTIAAESVRAAAAAADVLATAEQARPVALAAQAAAVQRRSAAERRGTSAGTTVAELQPRLGELQAGVVALLGSDTDVESRQRRLQAELLALRQLEQAEEAHALARRECAGLAADVAAEARELGFTSPEQARASLLDTVALEQLRAGVERHRQQRAELQALLRAASVPEAERQHAPDLAALATTAERAALVLREAEHRLAVATEADTALTRLARQVREHDDVHRDLRARHHQLDELSRCADGTGGGNALRMRLSAFVLAARLEEVAAAASQRLQVMSGGRFTLTHTDDLAKSGARSGLGLQVVDEWTGVARETSTLSGGESFLASLSLALGLADVVHADSGGSPIETLFVDEGFGSLDDETLEQVMGVLDGLRDGGRAVGLVSHVADLRSRIPAQVLVLKGRRGSSIMQANSTSEWAS